MASLRAAVAYAAYLILFLLVACAGFNVINDFHGGEFFEPRRWVYGYIGVFGQLGLTDKELGGYGPFCILGLLCAICLVYNPCSTSCCKPDASA
jgi:hypothetical protein